MSPSRDIDLDAAGELLRYFDARDDIEASRLLDVLQESAHCFEIPIAPEAHVLSALRCAASSLGSLDGPGRIKGRRIRRRASLRRRAAD
jgi:hypothetical protein